MGLFGGRHIAKDPDPSRVPGRMDAVRGASMAPRGFAANGHQITITAHTAEPAGRFQQGIIDVQYGLGMGPHSGTVRWGDAGHVFGGTRYAGDLGALQDFRGGVMVGKANTLRYRPNVAFPSTNGPVTNSVQDLLGVTATGRGLA